MLLNAAANKNEKNWENKTSSVLAGQAGYKQLADFIAAFYGFIVNNFCRERKILTAASKTCLLWVTSGLAPVYTKSSFDRFIIKLENGTSISITFPL